MTDPNTKTIVKELKDLGITESVVVDVLRDKAGGVAALNRLKTELDDQKKKEQDRKVTECSSLFPTLSQAFIRTVLSEHKWDVEASVGPLVEAADALQREKKEEVKVEAKKVPGIVSAAPSKSRSTVSIAAPSQVELGDTITIRWVVQEGVPQSSDWIALCPLEGQHSQYSSYVWVNPAQNNGTVVLTAPSVCGTYQCRYLTKHYDLLGASAPLRVGPLYELNTSVADRRIICKWKQSFGADHGRAWAGLYEVNAPEKSYLEMLWTTGRQGEISFPLPIKVGQYEIRLFSGGYIEAARSRPITAQQVDTIEAHFSPDLSKLQVSGEILSAVDVKYCWIGLYEAGTEDKNYLQSLYLTTNKYKVDMTIPSKRGRYEVRLFNSSGLLRAYENRLGSFAFDV